MKTPIKALHLALHSELKRIGYAFSGDPTPIKPIVIVDQITLNNEVTVKDEQDYNITFLFDVVTRQNDPIQAYGIVETLREKIDRNSLQSAIDKQDQSYTVQSFDFEQCDGLEELDEMGSIYRQLQRCRIVLSNGTNTNN